MRKSLILSEKLQYFEDPRKKIKIEISFFFYIFSIPDRHQITFLHRNYRFRKSPEDNSKILPNLRALPVIGFPFNFQDLSRKSRKCPEQSPPVRGGSRKDRASEVPRNARRAENHRSPPTIGRGVPILQKRQKRCNAAGSSVELVGVAKLSKNVKFLKHRDIDPKAAKKFQKVAKKFPTKRQLEWKRAKTRLSRKMQKNQLPPVG